MGDMICRSMAINCLGNSPSEMCMPWSEVERMLRALPGVDAVPVVRCKNCKHRPTDNSTIESIGGMDIVFPDDRCPCQCEDSYYNYYPGDDWFCPNGEWKEK